MPIKNEIVVLEEEKGKIRLIIKWTMQKFT